MNSTLPCRGRRLLAILSVPFIFGWAMSSSQAAIPPTFSMQRVINNTADDPGASGPNLTPAAIPPMLPPDTPPVETQPPVTPPPVVVQPTPVVQPPPVTTTQVPVDIPPSHPAAVSPEPASFVMGLLGSGIAGLIAFRRRRTRRVLE